MSSQTLQTNRSGFSLVEALVAVAITAIAGAALFASIGAAVRSSTAAAQVALAEGLAEQLMDEIAARRFPPETNSVPSGSTRATFDDVDDYDLWSATPPEDRTGRLLGTEGFMSGQTEVARMAQMRPDMDLMGSVTRSVTVERLELDGGTGWNVVTDHTNHRRVTVRIEFTNGNGTKVPLAEITRVFSYVPVSP
jgi:Tfp pilus assembly protein PilV